MSGENVRYGLIKMRFARFRIALWLAGLFLLGYSLNRGVYVGSITQHSQRPRSLWKILPLFLFDWRSRCSGECRPDRRRCCARFLSATQKRKDHRTRARWPL